MTKEREEILIATMGKIDRFIKEWDDRKDSLASCSDVEKVERKIDSHILNHRWSMGQIIAVIMGGLAMAVSVAEKIATRKP